MKSCLSSVAVFLAILTVYAGLVYALCALADEASKTKPGHGRPCPDCVRRP